jgi:hypothetical protein
MNEVKINPQTRQIIRNLEDTKEELDLLKTAKIDVVARQFINAPIATSSTTTTTATPLPSREAAVLSPKIAQQSETSEEPQPEENNIIHENLEPKEHEPEFRADGDASLRPSLTDIVKSITQQRERGDIQSYEETEVVTNFNTPQFANNEFTKLLSKCHLPPVEPPSLATQSDEIYTIKFSLRDDSTMSIDCSNLDYDIGISKSLQNMLGFEENKNLRLTHFKRRMLFRAYLHHHSRNRTYLNGRYFHLLKEMDSRAKITNQYWQFITEVLSLLQVSKEQAWVDFNYELPPAAILTNGNVWPRNTKFKDYFEEFPAFVDEMEKKTNEKFFTSPATKNSESPVEENAATLMVKFAKQGTLIYYFMLKVLWEEQNFGRSITTFAPPDLQYATDNLLIYSDIVESDLVNETRMALLRQFKLPQTIEKNTNVQSNFNPIQYKKCIRLEALSNIRIYISSIAGNMINFLRGPVFIVLHFIQEAMK